MSLRLLSRAIVVQSLFEWDLNLDSGPSNTDSPISILERNIGEFDPDSKDKPFMQRLFGGVLEQQHGIEEAIAKVEPRWPMNTIARVDRNILRLGVHELLFEAYSTVPERVVIGQAAHLAKNFGGENSARFVNKVLVSVYLDSVYQRLQAERFI